MASNGYAECMSGFCGGAGSEGLVGAAQKAAFEFRIMLSNGPTYCALAGLLAFSA